MTDLDDIVDAIGSAVAIYDVRRRKFAANACWTELFDEHFPCDHGSDISLNSVLGFLSNYTADEISSQYVDQLRNIEKDWIAGVAPDNAPTSKIDALGPSSDNNPGVDENCVLRIVSRSDQIIPLAVKYQRGRISFAESLAGNQKPDNHHLPSLNGQRVRVFRDFLAHCECPGYIRYKNRILFANQAMALLHGYDDAEDFLSNSKLSDHYRPEDRKAIAEIAETEGIILDTIHQIGKQGQEIHSVAVGSAFFDDGIQYRIVLIKDTHSHAHDENMLKQSEQRFRDIASCSGDWFWDTDADHKFTRISSNENLTSSFEIKNIKGNTIWQWIEQKHADGIVAGHENSVATIRDIMNRHQFIHDIELHVTDLSTLKPITLLLNAKPIYSDSQAFLGYRGITKDITYQKKLEHSLMEAKRRAEEQSRAKSAFLASMSHELRTPLTSILGYVELIRREAKNGRAYLDADQLLQIETIWKSGDQLRSLVNNVLSIERLESGFDRTDLAATDLNDVLVEMKQTFALASTMNRTSLVLVPGQFTPQSFYTDPVKLRQVLHNIIGNATKFTEDGEIRISTSCEDDAFTIQIKDTGIGMDRTQLDSILNSSSTTDISETLARGGGLGLVLCQHYVAQLGGELLIDSVPGEGTSVLIRLPDRRRDVNGLQPSYADAVTQAYHQPTTHQQQQKSKILIVDDNEDHGRLLRSMIDHLDVDVLQAMDGSQGLSLWQQYQPELIFMDLRMPGLDGSSATRKIRTKQLESDSTPCRIVAITADETNQSKMNLSHSGFDAFLSKPFKADEIHRILFDMGIVDTEIH